MQGINHYCQTIQALNVSTQYKIILNRRRKRTWPILNPDIRQSPDFSGMMAKGTVQFIKQWWIQCGQLMIDVRKSFRK